MSVEEQAATTVDVEQVLAQMSGPAQMEFHVAMATTQLRAKLAEAQNDLAQMCEVNDQLRSELEKTSAKLAEANTRIVDQEELLLNHRSSIASTTSPVVSEGVGPEMTQEVSPEMLAEMEGKINDLNDDMKDGDSDWAYDPPTRDPRSLPKVVQFGKGTASSLLTGEGVSGE